MVLLSWSSFIPMLLMGNNAQKKRGYMEQLQQVINQVVVLAPAIMAIIMGLISVAEVVVRLTPTKTDDGAVERVGSFFRKLFDLLKVPNYKAEGGKHEDSK